MASEVKVDTLSQKGSSGIVITDDIKLSSGKAIKNAAGTALLTQAGVLDNVSLGSSVTGTLGSGITFPAGHVLQVSSEFFGESFEQVIAGGTPEAINNGSSDWSVSITPSAASAGLTTSFLCLISIGRISPHNSGGGHGLGLILNRETASLSTDIGISTSGSNVPKCTWAVPTTSAASAYTSRTFHGSFMDSVDVPATPVAVVYTVKLVAHSGGDYTTLFNRGPSVTTGPDLSEGYLAVTGSTWTVMEIVG